MLDLHSVKVIISMTKQNSLKEKAYKIIKQYRRRGDNKIIAKKFNKSQEWVSMVCSPNNKKYWDEDIVVAMLDLIDKRRKENPTVIEKYIKKFAA